MFLAIGGAMLAGYSVAFILGGQTQRNAAVVAMAMSAERPVASAATSSTLPAPQFVLGGPTVEPARPTAVAGAEPPAASSAPSVAVAASASAAPTSAPTSAPAPAATPQASAALELPAASVPPRASVQATFAPTATSTATFVREDFASPLSGWPERPLAGWSAGYEDGHYAVEVQGEQPVGIAYPVADGNFRMAVDVSVSSGAAGIVFMYGQPASFLWAGVDADGALGVERIDGESITTLVPWQPLSGVANDAEPVRLEFRRQGDQLTLLAGGRQFATLQAPEGSWENRYGFVVAPRSSSGVAWFDNLIGERLP